MSVQMMPWVFSVEISSWNCGGLLVYTKNPKMDMNPEFRRTYLVCVVVLFLGNLYHFCLNCIKRNKFVYAIFLFGLVAAEIPISFELACFAGKQSPFSAAGVLNGISSANYHTGVKAEQFFCCLVADLFGEFATNGYPNGIRAIESNFGLGNCSMHLSVL